MFYILLLATVSVAIAADAEKGVQPELNPAESAQPIRVHDQDGLDLIRSRDHTMRQRLSHQRDNHNYGHSDYPNDRDGYRGPMKLDFTDEQGPQILRSPDPLPSHGHPDIERQNRIISDVFSPDYYQPTWVLDYRYLKTGGRDYTRGPGGQILILPKGVRTNEKKQFSDFDSLIEHLRLQRLSERARSRGYGHGDGNDARRGYQVNDYEAGRGYQINDYEARRGYQINDYEARRGFQADDQEARRRFQHIVNNARHGSQHIDQGHLGHEQQFHNYQSPRG